MAWNSGERPGLKQHCDFHRSVEASYICDTCGKSLCSYCERNHQIPFQCPECVSGYVRKKKRKDYVIAALIVLAFLSLFMMPALLRHEGGVYEGPNVYMGVKDVYIGIEEGSYNDSGDGKLDLYFRMYITNRGNRDSEPITIEIIDLDDSIMEGYMNRSVGVIPAGTTLPVTIGGFETDLGSHSFQIIVWQGDMISFRITKSLGITKDDVNLYYSDWDDDGSPEVDQPTEGVFGDASSLLAYVLVFVVIVILCAALYSRISGATALDSSARHQLFGYIKENPGSHFREIMRNTGMNVGTLKHHLDTLEREGFVKASRNGMYKLYYPKDMAVEKDPTLLGASQRYILDAVSRHPGISQKDLASILNLTPQTITYHMNQLQEASLIRVERDGKWNHVFPAERRET